MKVYNKLVRDNIPNIIKSNKQNCSTRILNDDEYVVELNKKLVEEVNEYLQSGELEELADIEEVILALVKAKGFSYNQFEEIRKSKASIRGGFDKKIFLINAD